MHLRQIVLRLCNSFARAIAFDEIVILDVMEPGVNDVRVNGGIARLLGANCHIVMLFVYIQINENIMIYNLYG